MAAAGLQPHELAQLQSHGPGGVQARHRNRRDYLQEMCAPLEAPRLLLTGAGTLTTIKRKACAYTGQRRPVVSYSVQRYAIHMIRSFRHKGIEIFFRAGKTQGIQARHAARLRLQLARLDNASGPQDMGAPGWRLHPLKGRLADHWAVWVDSHWRLTFAFERGDAVLVDYQDYH